MQSKPCLNQGWILDGCSFNAENVSKLFQGIIYLFLVYLKVDGDENEDLKDNPEIIIALEASDKYLKQKTMELSESELNTKYGSEAGKLTHHQFI